MDRGEAGDPRGPAEPGSPAGSPVRALATQVKPRFMAPAVATAAFGALLAPAVDPVVAGLHVACAALAVYVAHLRDERVDAYVRGEEDPAVPPSALRAATVAASAGFLLSVVGLWALAGPLPAALTLPLWLLGLAHAPYLDTNPVTVSLDYPVAVGLTIVGGYVAQTGALPARVGWVAVAFVALLAGATITLDRLDRAFDAGIGKRTVPVVVGDAGAALLAAGLVAAAGAVTVAGVAAGALPRPVLPSAVVPFVAGIASARASPGRATRVQMAASYPFAGLAFLGLCVGTSCAIAGRLPW
ncbi:UbiA family prenyltransferase (plasmid) [Halobaculum sp. CBA1158]|uniref:UbiA family prenyltransferase n=1 Tax=Halobaculum sp. CBA1158 TaxID=2904243 RepID=UPI001F2293E6|nr:UbiA family prenyltransferase [Halobaculum sp. CBA1158]UIP01486.1 UbiA family prenyltransferase [Halobaculum sp. CBA1158]